VKANRGLLQTWRIVALVGLSLAAATVQGQQSRATDAGPAAAASDGPRGEAAAESAQEVIITGFRHSLQEATLAKREAITFTDSVFAEDIGKFPDLNIAESLNRVPGVQLTRDAVRAGGVDT